jgi:hypothetical protein
VMLTLIFLRLHSMQLSVVLLRLRLLCWTESSSSSLPSLPEGDLPGVSAIGASDEALSLPPPPSAMLNRADGLVGTMANSSRWAASASGDYPRFFL